MDEQAEYSVLSKAAYDFFHGGEALAQSELQEYGLGDHRIDESLSDGNAVLITRPDASAVGTCACTVRSREPYPYYSKVQYTTTKHH